MAFSDAQLLQLRTPLTAADWTPEDVRLFGQAGKPKLIEIRDLLRRNGIAAAIELGHTELWLHDGQKGGRCVQGHLIHQYLQDHPVILASCVRVPDLKAIQAKGTNFYRKYYEGKAVFAWGDVQGDDVPCLVEDDGEVVLRELWLDNYWNANNPALRRTVSPQG